MSFLASTHSNSRHDDEDIPLYRLLHNSHLSKEFSFISSPPNPINDRLHKNILQSQQTVYSAKCFRKETAVNLIRSGLSDHVHKHAWVQIGNSTCSSRISSVSNFDLNDFISPIPVENTQLPPLIRFDGHDSLSPLNTSTNFDFIQSDKLEDLITTQHLEEIYQYFSFIENEYNTPEVSLKEFHLLFSKLLGLKNHHLSELNALFGKIDYGSTGFIGWDKFCTYMHLQLCEKENIHLHQKQVSKPSVRSPECSHSPHKENKIERCIFYHDGSLVSLSKDGILVQWNTHLDIDKIKQPEHTLRPRPKWITDFAILQIQSKIVLTTGDHEIQFYDLTTFDCSCQLTGLECVPVCICYSSDFESPSRCTLVFGDEYGCISVLSFSNFHGCLRVWNKSSIYNGIPSISLEKAILLMDNVRFVKWKIHQDWVNNIKYFSDIDSIISCSNDSSSSLVISKSFGQTNVKHILKEFNLEKKQNHSPGSQKVDARKHLPGDEIILKIHKGVKSFDFDRLKNIVVTGGSDRIIRIWNPYLPEYPIEKLCGHHCGIHFLCISSSDNRLISIDNDKTVRIWDLMDYSCLLTFGVKFHKIYSEIHACVMHQNQLVICSDVPTVFTFNTPRSETLSTHSSSVRSALYNRFFNCVVTACEGSIVKLWDLTTGKFIFEFSELHNGGGVSCMVFDKSGRRLITGSNNGEIKIWNFNNGQLLKELDKGNSKEVTDLSFVNLNNNQYIVSVGWDKELHIFPDNSESFQTRQTESVEWKRENLSHSTPLDQRIIGHSDDILALAFGLPNFLATSSFDGEIIVWSMLSGHIFSRFSVTSDVLDNVYYNDAVSAILFLDSRVEMRNSSSLVTNGPHGTLYFWNIYASNDPSTVIQATKNRKITCLDTDHLNMVLIAGDSGGNVSIWDINNFALCQMDTTSAKILRAWRAHRDRVTKLDLIESLAFLVTSSTDCNVRLWTLKSHCIGTFGVDTWNIKDLSTYIYPHGPIDICFDSSHDSDIDATAKFDPIFEESKPNMRTNINKFEVRSQHLPYFSTKLQGGKSLKYEKNWLSKDDGTDRTYQILSIDDLESFDVDQCLEASISKSSGLFLTHLK